MYAYFTNEQILEQIKHIDLTQIQIDWLLDLNRKYKQDTHHILNKFILKDLNKWEPIRRSIDTFYDSRYLFEAKYKDIKSFKTFDEYIKFETEMWKSLINNIKYLKKNIEPIDHKLNSNYIVYNVKKFEEAAALTHGHKIFDGNYYKFCFGINKMYFDRYISTNEEYHMYKKTKNPKFLGVKANNLYIIRDLNKTTKYTGIIPNCEFEDPNHVTILAIGLQPHITHSNYLDTIFYKNMDDLYKDNPELLFMNSINT